MAACRYCTVSLVELADVRKLVKLVNESGSQAYLFDRVSRVLSQKWLVMHLEEYSFSPDFDLL